MYKRDELSGCGYTTAQVELRKWTSVRPCLEVLCVALGDVHKGVAQLRHVGARRGAVLEEPAVRFAEAAVLELNTNLRCFEHFLPGPTAAARERLAWVAAWRKP